MNRGIPQISSTKSRQIFLSEQLQRDLELYALFLKTETGIEYEASDILSHLLLDEKKMGDLQPKAVSNSSKATYRLALRAWNNLDNTVQRTGLKIESVIDEVSSGLFKDKNFTAFKNSLNVSEQTTSETEKPSGRTGRRGVVKKSSKKALEEASVSEASE
jgi:hypothetical protein